MTVHALLAPWTGPHGGFPQFDSVRVAEFKPAPLNKQANDVPAMPQVLAAK